MSLQFLPPDDLDRDEYRRPVDFYDHGPSVNGNGGAPLIEKLLAVVDPITLFIMIKIRTQGKVNISAMADALCIHRCTIYRRIDAAEKRIKTLGFDFFVGHNGRDNTPS